jgi:hypothetical protein
MFLLLSVLLLLSCPTLSTVLAAGAPPSMFLGNPENN